MSKTSQSVDEHKCLKLAKYAEEICDGESDVAAHLAVCFVAISCDLETSKRVIQQIHEHMYSKP